MNGIHVVLWQKKPSSWRNGGFRFQSRESAGSDFRTQSDLSRIPTWRFTPRSHGPPWECRPASLKDGRLPMCTTPCFLPGPAQVCFPPAYVSIIQADIHSHAGAWERGKKAFILAEWRFQVSVPRVRGIGLQDPIRSLPDSDLAIYSSFPWSSVGMQTGSTLRRQTTNVHYPLFSYRSRPGLFSARICVDNSGGYSFPRRSMGTRNNSGGDITFPTQEHGNEE